MPAAAQGGQGGPVDRKITLERGRQRRGEGEGDRPLGLGLLAGYLQPPAALVMDKVPAELEADEVPAPQGTGREHGDHQPVAIADRPLPWGRRAALRHGHETGAQVEELAREPQPGPLASVIVRLGAQAGLQPSQRRAALPGCCRRQEAIELV